jgi:hypothetical protein
MTVSSAIHLVLQLQGMLHRHLFKLNTSVDIILA